MTVQLDAEKFKYLTDYRDKVKDKIKMEFTWEGFDAIKESARSALMSSHAKCTVTDMTRSTFKAEKHDHVKIPMWYEDQGDPSVGIWGSSAEFDVIVSKDHPLTDEEEGHVEDFITVLSENLIVVENSESVETMSSVKAFAEAEAKMREEMIKDEEQTKAEMEELDLSDEELEKLLEDADYTRDYIREQNERALRSRDRF